MAGSTASDHLLPAMSHTEEGERYGGTTDRILTNILYILYPYTATSLFVIHLRLDRDIINSYHP